MWNYSVTNHLADLSLHKKQIYLVLYVDMQGRNSVLNDITSTLVDFFLLINANSVCKKTVEKIPSLLLFRVH